MSNQTTENLLPDIIAKNFNLALEGSKISFRDIEISNGKTAFDIGDDITQKICAAAPGRALAFWNAFDAESQYQLAYLDKGRFNMDLIQKLDIRGDVLCKAFAATHAKDIFALDAAPLSSQLYAHTFITLHTELLSTCRQLASKHSGQARLAEFLDGFDPEFLATLVRHEIAVFYIDENCNQINTEMDDEEEDNVEEWEDDFAGEVDEESELFVEPGTLQEFHRAFKRGDILPATLELTSWLQHNAPHVFLTARNRLIFFSEERGVAIWERPNPLDETKMNTDEFAETGVKETLASLAISGAPVDQEVKDDLRELVVIEASDEKEWLRLVRLYTISHPFRKNYLPVNESNISSLSNAIANILLEAGIDTGKLQTFEQLRDALWKVTGFTALKKWVDEQRDSNRLLESSGKKRLFQEMAPLYGETLISDSSIIYISLERTRYAISKLYGWFSLVKIFWNIAGKQRRFTRLASVENDTLVWEENIACCTLIIQATLGVEKLSFSLDDMARFCKACKKPGWAEAMKKAFKSLAQENGALSAVPIFHEYIDYLGVKSGNLFRVLEDVRISSNAERIVVRKTRKLTENYKMMVTSFGEAPKFARLLFLGAIAKIIEREEHREAACQYFDFRLSENSTADLY